MPRTAGIALALLLARSICGSAPALNAKLPKIGDPAPDIKARAWINSQSLALAGLRGKVVLVEFWTYG